MNNLHINLGIIGVGNMGSALLKGIASSSIINKNNIFINDSNTVTLKKISAENGVTTVSIDEIFLKSNVIILSVKPDVLRSILPDIKKYINNQIIVSIAAGVTISEIETFIGVDKKIIRVMPNTCAMVLEAMSGICVNKNISDEDLNLVKNIFDCIGKTIVISEKNIDAVVGISGSSPAFIFQIIEAMSDAGVKEGLSRSDALFMAAQSVFGSAKMVLETKIHPAILKDMVTSPAGTTIDGVYEMEKNGVRAGVISAISAATEKSKKISKK